MSVSASDDMPESPNAILGARKQLLLPPRAVLQRLERQDASLHLERPESEKNNKILVVPSGARLRSMVNFCSSSFLKFFSHQKKPSSPPSRGRSLSEPTVDFCPARWRLETEPCTRASSSNGIAPLQPGAQTRRGSCLCAPSASPKASEARAPSSRPPHGRLPSLTVADNIALLRNVKSRIEPCTRASLGDSISPFAAAAAETHARPLRGRSVSLTVDNFPQQAPELEPIRRSASLEQRRVTQEMTIRLLSLQATRPCSSAPVPAPPAPRRMPSVRFAVREQSPMLNRHGWIVLRETRVLGKWNNSC
ncbi:hypothetical protein T484DRAFT_1987174 [Baffinella frigidus]|nr:hypothetical protein T484DRAFT_1987174 [Cryptophyta sp. CCMP2293]